MGSFTKSEDLTKMAHMAISSWKSGFPSKIHMVSAKVCCTQLWWYPVRFPTYWELRLVSPGLNRPQQCQLVNQSRHHFMFEHEFSSASSEHEMLQETRRNSLLRQCCIFKNQDHKLQHNPRSLMRMAHAKWGLELGVGLCDIAKLVPNQRYIISVSQDI